MFEIVILIAIPELMQNDFDALSHLVSLEKQERIKRFHFFQDARNCLLGDILTRIEISRATGLNNRGLEFSANAYGKPFLVGAPHIHFNISHTGCYVACVVADEPVGIDIELVKSIDIQIAERFFTPDETIYITQSDHIRCFYEVWTKKESRIKYEGKGLYKPLTSFSVFEVNESEQVTYHEVFRNDEVICHVCSKKRDMPSVRVIDTAVFLQSIKKYVQ